MTKYPEIFTGQEARDWAGDDDELRRLNDIRAKSMRISNEQARESSALILDIYRKILTGGY